MSERRNGYLSAQGIPFILCAVFLAGCAGTPVERPHSVVKAASAGNAGVDAFKSGDYQRALDKFKESLRLDRATDNREAVLLDLLNIARTLVAVGEPKAAPAYLDEAAELAVVLGNDKMLTEAYATNAKVELVLDNPLDALVLIEKALAIDAKTGYKSGARLNLKALIYMGTSRAAEADVLLKEALKHNRSSDDKVEAANSLRLLGEVMTMRGEYKQAAQYYGAALAIDRAGADTLKLIADMERMAEVQSKLGRHDEAVLLLERLFRMYEDMGMKMDAAYALDAAIAESKASGMIEKTRRLEGIRMTEALGNRQ